MLLPRLPAPIAGAPSTNRGKTSSGCKILSLSRRHSKIAGQPLQELRAQPALPNIGCKRNFLRRRVSRPLFWMNQATHVDDNSKSGHASGSENRTPLSWLLRPRGAVRQLLEAVRQLLKAVPIRQLIKAVPTARQALAITRARTRARAMPRSRLHRQRLLRRHHKQATHDLGHDGASGRVATI